MEKSLVVLPPFQSDSCLGTAGSAAFRSLFLALIACATASAVIVEPDRLDFEARLDDPAVLTLTVDPAGEELGGLTADIEGFGCDRRITRTKDGKFLVQVAPDTVEPGNVSGKIILKSRGKQIGDPIPVSGIVRPWVKVAPFRLFVGSIGHGEKFATPQSYVITLSSDNEPFDITAVELPELKDATWASDPPLGILAHRKTLTLTFSPEALAAGFPFGALAKKYALVYTSHPRASYLAISIMGMISVNTTGRDYSQYLYNGHLRWQGPWPTPNIAAAFLSTATILLCGIGAAAHKAIQIFTERREGDEKAGGRKGRSSFTQFPLLPSVQFLQITKWIITIVIFVAMAGGCFLLAKTYSRGGWVAMAAGIGVLTVGIRKPRFYPLGLAGLFGLSVAFHPAGLKRAASTAEISGDRSVSNRLLLWQGAFQMMAEHPWTGVGVDKFGETFMRDYQLPTHTQSYSTAINDFLSLGTERGIPAMVAVTSSLLMLAGTGFWIAFTTGSNFSAGCAAALTSLLIGSWFSSVAFQSHLFLFVFAAAGGILIVFFWQRFKTRRKLFEKRSVKIVLFAASVWVALAAMLTAGCLAAGWIALRTRPEVAQINIAQTSVLKVTPRWRASKGAVVYLGDRDDKPADLLKGTLRPLAQKGWTVFSFEQPKFASDARRKTLKIIESLRNTKLLEDNWILAGHRQGAQIALGIAPFSNPSTVAAYMATQASPFPELSPESCVKYFHGRALLCAQQADEMRSASHLDKILRNAPHAESDIHPGNFSSSSRDWQLWINTIDNELESLD